MLLSRRVSVLLVGTVIGVVLLAMAMCWRCPLERGPLLANDRIISRGQGHYEVVGVGHLRGPYYLLLGGAGFTAGYVFAHGAFEYQGLLQQHRDVLP